jgi:hypothetical protein
MFCRSLFVFLFFSFGHCVVCSSSIYGSWIPLFIFKLYLRRKFILLEIDTCLACVFVLYYILEIQNLTITFILSEHVRFLTFVFNSQIINAIKCMNIFVYQYAGGRRGRDRMMSWVRISIRVRCTTLCDKVCQSLVAGR